MERELLFYGNPLLRQKAEVVQEITEEIRLLVRDMIETMHVDGRGIGLAAPQIGCLLRIFVTCVPIQQQDGSWKQGVDRVYINPEILSHSEEKETRKEGCLSIPEIRIAVARPARITIRATALDGSSFTEELEALFACNFMHENDHLNGVLIVDHANHNDKKRLAPKLRQLIHQEELRAKNRCNG